jgi:hypothetical protein
MPQYLDQAYNAQAVTPSDTQDLSLAGGNFNNSTNSGALPYVGTGGDMKVTMVGGQTVTFKNIPDGTFMPIQVVRIWSTGTDATDILALF